MADFPPGGHHPAHDHPNNHHADDYHSQRRRRIAQFTTYLASMRDRTLREVNGSCFLIFSDADPNAKGDRRSGSASVEIPVEATVGANADDGGLDVFLHEDDSPDGTDQFWRDDSENRFVQFSFGEHWFCIDLPNTTLAVHEAERILRDRIGFFYVLDRPAFEFKGENAERFQPLRRVYLYGDERDAAEDMAYVLFDLWRFPVETRLYVTAAAFGDYDSSGWEKGFPL